MELLAVLERLQNVKPKRGGGFTARCPVHGDRQNSLSIDERDNRLLLHCFAGCENPAIASAIDVAMSDLFTDTPPVTRGIIPARPTKIADFEIRNRAGELVAVHVRRDFADGTKRFTWRQPDGTYGLNGVPLTSMPLYGIHQLPDDVNTRIVVVEGEKARDALQARGVPAVATVTGAGTLPSAERLADLADRHIVVWPDNDDAGRAHMEQMARTLVPIAATVAIADWTAAPPHGDAADYEGDPWDVIDTAGVLDAEAATRPVAMPWVRLPPVAWTPPPPRLVEPYVCDSRSYIFGAGDTGKSVFVAFLIGALAGAVDIPEARVQRELRVGVLDYEDNQDEWADRLHRVGLPAAAVPYLAPSRPLAANIEEVRAWIADEGVDLVAVDSGLAAAGGTDAMAPETPLGYYRALKRLERPTLTLFHVPKSAAAAEYPFGSVYWSNGARLGWRAERVDDLTGHVVKLTNTKHNRWPRANSSVLRIDWQHERIALTSALNLEPAALTHERIEAALLREGTALTAKVIASRLTLPEGTVRSSLEGHPEKFRKDGTTMAELAKKPSDLWNLISRVG
jgi:hypothetical protein